MLYSVPSLPTFTPVPGCTINAFNPTSANQGYYYVYVIQIGPGMDLRSAVMNAPSTNGAVSIYLYAGGAVFDGTTSNPLTQPPPPGSFAAATTSGNTATLLTSVTPGGVYTLYFYSTVDLTTDGKSVNETVSCAV